MSDRVDAAERQAHYGARRQAWDDIVDASWGPGFAGGNVLKYLRRDKEPDHSLDSARWYWRQIVDRSERRGLGYDATPWIAARSALWDLLAVEERERLLG